MSERAVCHSALGMCGPRVSAGRPPPRARTARQYYASQNVRSQRHRHRAKPCVALDAMNRREHGTRLKKTVNRVRENVDTEARYKACVPPTPRTRRKVLHAKRAVQPSRPQWQASVLPPLPLVRALRGGPPQPPTFLRPASRDQQMHCHPTRTPTPSPGHELLLTQVACRGRVQSPSY